jgi:Replication initiator protein A (RepA) N-terminus
MAKIIQVPYPTKRYFTNEDHANLIYFQFPKILMYGDAYKTMSSDSKLLYMLCLDLIKLSMKRNWKDEYGRYYIKLSVETIKNRLSCQNTKAIKLKKELINHQLMEVVRVGQGKADRLYILQLDYSEDDIYKANNDHENIENDEIVPDENTGDLVPVENSEKQNSRIPKSRTLEFHKSEPIKNDLTKNNLLKNNSNKHKKDYIDDDKRTPDGDSAEHNEEQINLVISNFRESTKDDLTNRSFNAVVRKVIDKYNQGKVDSLRDYLATALANKIDELELRRAKNEAREQLKANSSERIHEKKQELENQPIRKKVPFYNWLEE